MAGDVRWHGGSFEAPGDTAAPPSAWRRRQHDLKHLSVGYAAVRTCRRRERGWGNLTSALRHTRAW